MINPLDDVPLNTKKVYVRGITPGGCKIYMPADTLDPVKQHKIKTQLQIYLNSQFPPEPQIVA